MAHSESVQLDLALEKVAIDDVLPQAFGSGAGQNCEQLLQLVQRVDLLIDKVVLQEVGQLCSGEANIRKL